MYFTIFPYALKCARFAFNAFTEMIIPLICVFQFRFVAQQYTLLVATPDTSQSLIIIFVIFLTQMSLVFKGVISHYCERFRKIKTGLRIKERTSRSWLLYSR